MKNGMKILIKRIKKNKRTKRIKKIKRKKKLILEIGIV
jgi:hypothetical protein